MADEVAHEGNRTPDASDDDVKRMDADTEQNANPGAGVDQGAGSDGPTGGGDVEENSDPKAGAGNQQVDDPKESAGQHQEKG